FHDFLIKHIERTFGENWWKQQLKTKDRQEVVKWASIYAQMTKKFTNEQHKIDEFIYEADSPAPAWALLTLGYDLLCLQAEKMLPDFMIQRLRKYREFQSVRYEIAVSSIMARCGFRNSFLDELKRIEKHCEFIAIHKELNIRVGVEAKSRRRRGVIHENGNFDYIEDYKGILDLVRSANKQKPRGMPFFIFVDLNLPHTPGASFYDKPWIKDIEKMLEKLGTPSSEHPTPYTSLIFTNFAHQYGDMETLAYPGEKGILISLYPEHPILNMKIFDVLDSILKRYDNVPREL
ncbi:MAG: hypothetical protein ACRENZ_03475, partial [Thermodesulfobacteriota bacterium]